ncbi:uncharacterized protein Bfra_001018 [Botrytis fragariae]|uniref:Uncharacterized protein n=1 Tax=Botrytis fragariae TaxID=1964551 RepID=A0A8H6B4G2_9HELO|nr:uncharacterized protein Bfra_001018 [Botrytis fragariae]KAF5878847.1 hypothetical protein Bfra_001018 [Botrytis fragariae]
MSQASIKNVVSRDGKQEQCNVGLLTRQRAENTTRNKVVWKKNILPGGRVDWVIVGFGAPLVIEKKVDAQVDAREILAGRNKKDSAGLIVSAVPIELPRTIENGVLDLLTRNGGSREMGKDKVEKTGAITMKVAIREVIILENKNKSGHNCEVMKSGETSENHEESEKRMTVSANGRKSILLEGTSDGKAPPTTIELFKPQNYTSSVAPLNLPSVSGREDRELERESRDLRLRMQSNQEPRATRSTLSPKRRLSNPQSRTSSLTSTSARRPHPAEIIKSFRSGVSVSSNSLREVYSPIFNTQNSKARLTTSVLPETNQSITRRPKTTITVASRMITHALGIRAVPRVLEPEIMAEFDKACSALFCGIQLDESDKKVKTTPVDCCSELQTQEDTGFFYDLSRVRVKRQRPSKIPRKGNPEKCLPEEEILAEKLPKEKSIEKRSHSRLRDLREGIFRENIDQGTKVYKDAFDLSWDDQIEENMIVLRNMYNMEVNIAEYAAWSLPDSLWIQLENEYSETIKLSEMLCKYWGDDDEMFKSTPLNYLHSLTPKGVISYTIEGLKKLVYFRADDYPIEWEISKYLNLETFSFCETNKRPIDVETVKLSVCPMINERLKKSGSSISIEAAKNPWSNRLGCPTVAALPPMLQIDIKVSQIYVFVAALKYFISKYLDSKAASHHILSPLRMQRENTEWYVGLSNRCQCKLGVHTWLEEFVCDISAKNIRADRLKHHKHYNNYAKNIQEGKTKTPFYVISRLYLNFITKRCFGEQTRPMGMILLQAFAMKWMHYTTLPFDEDD